MVLAVNAKYTDGREEEFRAVAKGKMKGYPWRQDAAEKKEGGGSALFILMINMSP